MRIYIVTGGAYNDCEVCAAFSTREAAEAFLPVCADDSEDEQVLEVLVDNPFPLGFQWKVWLHADGTPWCVSRGPYSPHHGDEPQDHEGNFLFYVFAETEEEAVKAANEKRLTWFKENL